MRAKARRKYKLPVERRPFQAALSQRNRFLETMTAIGDRGRLFDILHSDVSRDRQSVPPSRLTRRRSRPQEAIRRREKESAATGSAPPPAGEIGRDRGATSRRETCQGDDRRRRRIHGARRETRRRARCNGAVDWSLPAKEKRASQKPARPPAGAPRPAIPSPPKPRASRFPDEASGSRRGKLREKARRRSRNSRARRRTRGRTGSSSRHREK